VRESVLEVEEVGDSAWSERSGVGDRVEDNDESEGSETVEPEDPSESGSDDASDSMDSMKSSMSECAHMYFVFIISSSRGFRKETLLTAGNIGRDEATLRLRKCLSGLFDRMDGTL
jgi:hypothetical protein